MAFCRAVVLRSTKSPAAGAPGGALYDVEVCRVPTPSHLDTAGYALVRVSHAALNRRDVWIRMGLYPGLQFDTILGADCCGTLEAVDAADGISATRLAGLIGTGADVVVNPSCDWDVAGQPSYDEAAPGPFFRILGMPQDGTLCEWIAIDASQVFPKPAHLTSAQAAALPLAGLTAYRACFRKAEVAPGDVVLVSGIGGGVALLCLQFCIAAGAKEVWVTSSSDVKIAKAVEMGATGGFNYAASDAKTFSKTLQKALRGRLNKVIDGAGGGALNSYIRAMNPGGIIASYGATARDPKNFEVTRMFLKNIELRGSTMGSPRDFENMLSFVRRERIVPVVDSVVAMRCGDGDEGADTTRVVAAMERMRNGKQMGKIVIQVGRSTGSSRRQPDCEIPSRL